MADPLDGVQFPCRARVDSSAADADGYRATVTVLDGAGTPTRTVLEDVPLDPLWSGRDGAGFFAPPAKGRIVAITWMGGSGGHPVIVSSAWRKPAVPADPVDPGTAAWLDGEGGEFRFQGPGRWRWIDGRGAELGVDGKKWVVVGDGDNLLAALVEIAEAIRDGLTIPAAIGTPLPFNVATIAAINAALNRLRLVLREP